MADISYRIKSMIDELTHLEINTIIKPNMTGRKMPKTRHALIEIAKRYRIKLIQMGYHVLDENDIKPGSYDSFDLIREKAYDAIKDIQEKASVHPLTQKEEEDLILLYRIKTMSDQIKGVFNALRRRNVETWDNAYSHEEIEKTQAELPLEPHELILIRKIWEVGLEQIAMQTIIHLDGDVMTRIHPKYCDEKSEIIHRIHNESMETAIDFWVEFIGIVKDFFHGFFNKSFFKK